MIKLFLYSFEWILFHLGVYKIIVWLRPTWVPLADFQDYPFQHSIKATQLLKKGMVNVANKNISLDFSKNYSPALMFFIHSFEWSFALLPFDDQESRTLFYLKVNQWFSNRWGTYSLLDYNRVIRKRLTNFILMNHVWKESRKRFQKKFYQILNYDVLFLERTYKLLTKSQDQFYTLAVLILSKTLFYYPNHEKTGSVGNADLDILLHKFLGFLNKIILPDGMHISIDVDDHINVFQALVLIREALIRMDYSVPPLIQQVLDKMGPVVKFFVMSDGKLGIFYNNQELSSEILDWYILKSGSSGRPSNILRYAGFVRIMGHNFSMLIHTGSKHQSYRLGTGSLMISFKEHRFMVNCGRPFGVERSIFPLFPLQSMTTFDVGYLNLKLKEHIFTDHYKYLVLEGALRGGGMYRRYLYVSTKNFDIRGEDEFVMTTGDAKEYKMHFHLAPYVTCSVLRNHKTAILKLPVGTSGKTAASKTWYYFETNASLSIEKSVYSGHERIYQATQQLVIADMFVNPHTTVKWRLFKI